MSKIVIIDAGGANTGSVRAALTRLGVDAPLVTDAASILNAERVILPGVGTARQVMAQLDALNLVDTLRTLDTPLLGICVGMQVLFEYSEEEDTKCLGLLAGRVRKLTATATARVPNMGWNTLRVLRNSALLEDVHGGAKAYFVHSYAAAVSSDTVASCRHGNSVFSALVQRGHLCGAQFHPERSSTTGAAVLQNFLRCKLR